LDSYPISSNSLEKFYSINGKHFGEQYKHHLSDYSKWEQKDHADQWLLFTSNCGEYLSIDETSLSNGELYTILTNKEAKGKKGSIVAIIEGTQADPIIKIIKQLPLELRRKVKEVTLDMAGAMGNIVDSCFPRASKVIDRFHVQKLAYDALQQIRIKHRWSAIDKENEAIKFAKEKGEKYKPELLSNGDTLKQLLARSRYLLFKSRDKWKEKQNERATLLFELYPDIEKAYNLTHKLRMIFSQTEVKEVAYTKLAKWFNEVDISGFTTFSKISNTIQNHYAEILNFFDNRSTNASAESFNAKLKAFRATQRGVVDIPFFLYRLTKIYA
jgi:transposase